MINLTGTITVKTINGRNGDFNVGRLTTEIGEFNVKEGIEEYAPGQYAEIGRASCGDKVET